MRGDIRGIIMLFALVTIVCRAAGTRKFVVRVPVTNIRSEPTDEKKIIGELHDRRQTTQLLLGDYVQASAAGPSTKQWINVQAVEQPLNEPSRRSWIGIPGWVKCDDLVEIEDFSAKHIVITRPRAPYYQTPDEDNFCDYLYLGTLLRGRAYDDQWWEIIPIAGEPSYIKKEDAIDLQKQHFAHESILRRSIITAAEQFLGNPYVLGGCSFFDKENTSIVTGADCSALTYLIFRTHGMIIPRNSRDQYSRCSPCQPTALQQGDCMFLAHTADPSSIFHVLLYCGNQQFIEAHGDSHTVRRITCIERIGKPLTALKQGERVGKNFCFFGSLIASSGTMPYNRTSFQQAIPPKAFLQPITKESPL